MPLWSPGGRGRYRNLIRMSGLLASRVGIFPQEYSSGWLRARETRQPHADQPESFGPDVASKSVRGNCAPSGALLTGVTIVSKLSDL